MMLFSNLFKYAYSFSKNKFFFKNLIYRNNNLLILKSYEVYILFPPYNINNFARN